MGSKFLFNLLQIVTSISPSVEKQVAYSETG